MSSPNVVPASDLKLEPSLVYKDESSALDITVVVPATLTAHRQLVIQSIGVLERYTPNATPSTLRDSKE